jgi:hypothetical protein
MPLEDWIQHCKVAQFLYDWQTLIAGLLALGAAAWTIHATRSTAKDQIKASGEDAKKVIDATREQTSVAQKQIDTTLRLEQERVASEANAFRAMLEAATVRVFAEAAWARKAYPHILTQKEGSSIDAFEVRNCITKGGFAELRAACVRQGSPLTFEFFDLEREIDNFASRWGNDKSTDGVPIRKGQHAGLSEQLGLIEKMATELHRKATKE